jgi:hypothetical protein
MTVLPPKPRKSPQIAVSIVHTERNFDGIVSPNFPVTEQNCLDLGRLHCILDSSMYPAVSRFSGVNSKSGKRNFFNQKKNLAQIKKI